MHKEQRLVSSVGSRSVPLLAIMIILLFAASSAQRQDLQTAWEDYTSIEARLEEMLARRTSLDLKEENLQQEITDLRDSRSWLNGWLVEMQLSRKTMEQTQLADSLQALQKKVEDFSRERQLTLAALKETYRQQVTEAGGEFTLAEKRNALVLGQRLMTEGHSTADLPDYSPILTGSYEDDTVRSLVLEDLRSVLGAKLTVIDSLLAERRSERELAHRLDAFHRDLGVQLESDRDPASAGSGSFLSSASPDEAATDSRYTGLTVVGDAKSRSAQSSPDVSILQSEITRQEDVTDRIDIDPIDASIRRLQSKQHQYQQLLRKIEAELSR